MGRPPLDAARPGCGRRSFCALAGAFAAAAALPRANAQEPPPDLPEDPRRVTAETRASLPKGTIKDYRKQGRFFLVADARGIYAITAICTHRGCTVHLEGDAGFGCPCHDSEYDLQGTVTQGPAERPLKHFEVREQSPGGFLVVDLSSTVDPRARL